MALNDAALTTGATAIEAEITHMQAHSSNVGGAWDSAAVGSRVAVSGSVDADGDITWTGVAFTGLSAGQAVAAVSYWTAASGGSNRGGTALTGDTAANSSGEFTVSTLTETGSAS